MATPARFRCSSVTRDASHPASASASAAAARARPVNGAMRGPPPTAGRIVVDSSDPDPATPFSSPSHHRFSSNSPGRVPRGTRAPTPHGHLRPPSLPLRDVLAPQRAHARATGDEPVPDEISPDAERRREADAGDDDATVRSARRRRRERRVVRGRARRRRGRRSIRAASSASRRRFERRRRRRATGIGHPSVPLGRAATRRLVRPRASSSRARATSRPRRRSIPSWTRAR